jgi:hypothetical protein
MRRKTMRPVEWISVAMTLGCLAAAPAGAVQDSPEPVRIQLSRPSEPCVVECALVYGGIVIEAYDGNEVVVEARPRAEKESNSDRNRGGLKKISVASASLTLEEKDNRVTIGNSSWAKGTDIRVQVPVRTSLELTCVNDGDIRVQGVSGYLELQNVNGKVTALEVSGAVVAATTNGDVTVELKAVESGKPMSFVTFNGDVNVTLPPTTKATIKMETGQGDAYTDFEIEKSARKAKRIEENTRDKDGAYRVRLEEAFYGDLNGGGPEFSFRTFNGDIYIRKGTGK